MRPSIALLACAAAASPAFAVPHAPPPTGPEVAIPFFGEDGLSDYRIDAPTGIYLRAATDGQWYYLRVLPDCPRLAAARGFGVEAGPQGRLDRSSAITVEGERCLLSSVVRSPAPPGYRGGRHG